MYRFILTTLLFNAILFLVIACAKSDDSGFAGVDSSQTGDETGTDGDDDTGQGSEAIEGNDSGSVPDGDTSSEADTGSGSESSTDSETGTDSGTDTGTGTGEAPDTDTATDSCQDRDGDGWGEGCAPGPDCNDDDDTIWENCVVCDNKCATKGATSCSGGKLSRCEADKDGCLDWGSPADCEEKWCGDTTSCGTCVHECDEVGVKCNANGITLETCTADGNGCRRLSTGVCVGECKNGSCAEPFTAAAAVSSPTSCGVVGDVDEATLEFTVSSLEGIEKFTFDVKAAAGCEVEPAGGSLSGYPTTGTAKTPSSHTIHGLEAGRWYKYSIVSTAKDGYKSSSKVGWFRTGDEQWMSIPSGSFWMGSPDGGCPDEYPGDCDPEPGRRSDETLHRVTLTKSFAVMQHEVTQNEFRVAWEGGVLGWNPSGFVFCGNSCPVESVSWFDAVAYANRLSLVAGLKQCYEIENIKCVDGSSRDYPRGCMRLAQGGINSATITLSESTPYECEGYRLPTEAEWEYAIRAGSTSAFYTSAGNNGGITNPGCPDPADSDDPGVDPNLDQIGWYCGNASDTTHTSAAKEANAWGLYDMSGNVLEWVWDRYAEYDEDDQTDPAGHASAPDRTLRGGSWDDEASHCRSAYRDGAAPGHRANSIGFRLARTIF